MSQTNISPSEHWINLKRLYVLYMSPVENGLMHFCGVLVADMIHFAVILNFFHRFHLNIEHRIIEPPNVSLCQSPSVDISYMRPQYEPFGGKFLTNFQCGSSVSLVMIVI